MAAEMLFVVVQPYLAEKASQAVHPPTPPEREARSTHEAAAYARRRALSTHLIAK